MVDLSRLASEQMGQMSSSLMLWHTRQYLISFRTCNTALENASESQTGWRNKCSTRRSAVFRPMPGSLQNSLTAFSRRTDGYVSTCYRYMPNPILKPIVL